MKNELRIRNDLQMETLYQWPNPPTQRPKELRSARYERIQRQLDADKRKWFNAMVWGMQTTGKHET
jgi:hypothetical protein